MHFKFSYVTKLTQLLLHKIKIVKIRFYLNEKFGLKKLENLRRKTYDAEGFF